MFVFRKVWRAFLSSHIRFEIRPFALIPLISGEIEVNSFAHICLTLEVKFGKDL